MITTNERQEKLLDQHAALINPSQAREMRDAGLGIIESRREGAYVWDQSGTRYIDCRQETSVFNVGRRNPELIDVLCAALKEYDVGNSLFFSEPRVQLAHRLGELSPGGALRAVAYGVSGGEVNDFALKLSRAITRRPRVIAMDGSYLGSTGFAASASGDARFRQPFEPLIPNITFVEFGDADALEAEMGEDVACVILETVQTWAGVRTPPSHYLQRVRDLCDKNGSLMILDEHETGFGRCGKTFALDIYGPGVVPDIMTLGKALGGGLYPFAAAVYRKEYLKFWEQHPFSHLSTFAGSDLACVIGLSTIDWIHQHRLGSHAEARGAELTRGLQKFAEKYDAVVRSVRACGLLVAIDFANDELGPQMSRDLSQFGVLASCSPVSPSTMFVIPSLVVSSEDIKTILDAFSRALAGNQSLMAPRPIESLQSLMHS